MARSIPPGAEREQRVRELADKLQFAIDRRGSRFALTRVADVSRPVCFDDITLSEAEQILHTWRQRGPRGR